MTSNLLVSFIFGLGVGAWVYSKIMRRSGGNTQSALTVAAVSGVAGLVLFMVILAVLFRK